MSNSLLKYAARADKRGNPGGDHLWWHRAADDGAPFRGPFAPEYTEEEFEARAVKVRDFRNAFFDVTDQAQNAQFCDVMDCCANGWFQLYHIERFWKGSNKHYVEWFEYYMEDGRRTPYAQSGPMEIPHG